MECEIVVSLKLHDVLDSVHGTITLQNDILFRIVLYNHRRTKDSRTPQYLCNSGLTTISRFVVRVGAAWCDPWQCVHSAPRTRCGASAELFGEGGAVGAARVVRTTDRGRGVNVLSSGLGCRSPASTTHRPRAQSKIPTTVDTTTQR